MPGFGTTGLTALNSSALRVTNTGTYRIAFQVTTEASIANLSWALRIGGLIIPGGELFTIVPVQGAVYQVGGEYIQDLDGGTTLDVINTNALTQTISNANPSVGTNAFMSVFRLA